METSEFLRLQGLELELRAMRWRDERDAAFVAWLIQNHASLDDHHLACGFAIAGELNMKGIRDLARRYAQASNLLVRVAASGLLAVHDEKGWRD